MYYLTSDDPPNFAVQSDYFEIIKIMNNNDDHQPPFFL